MTGFTRRGLIGGAAAAALYGALPAAAAATTAAARPAQARRRFTILRDGKDIGFHTIALSREGEDLRVAIDIEIVVRVFGIAAYRYEMRNREVWRGGRLMSMDCSVNDDGKAKTVRAAREAGALRIDGPLYTGPAPDLAATTTYFTQDFLKRDTWISTDNGELYQMSVAAEGSRAIATGAGRVECARYRATNNADFDVTLYYDARGEWASVAFDAGGKRAIYRPDHLDDSFKAVWAG